MEYVYGTSVICGVERENLKIVGGPALREGEYLTTVREYDDSSITDRCRIDRHYHSDTDEDGTRLLYHQRALPVCGKDKGDGRNEKSNGDRLCDAGGERKHRRCDCGGA